MNIFTRALKDLIPFALALTVMTAVVVMYIGSVQSANANPSFFAPQAKLTTSTTSPVFMAAGTATTTTVYDSFGINGTNENGTQALTGADSAELLVQFTATSTTSQLNINIEYSDDGIDWYADTPTNVNGFGSTTVSSVLLASVPQYQWKFASSTIGGIAVLPTGNRDARALNIKTPTRYERAVISCAVGGANCTVWAQWVPKKQNQ